MLSLLYFQFFFCLVFFVLFVYTYSFIEKRLFVQMEPVDVAGILQMARDADLMTDPKHM